VKVVVVVVVSDFRSRLPLLQIIFQSLYLCEIKVTYITTL